jgi:16S rRNA (adenine1518-N6/adenine1519-N6)-dimethyltransferase
MIELTKTLFAQRRKTILNNLRAGRSRLGLADEAEIGGLLSSCGLDPKRRAETLSVEEIARLANAVTALLPAPF